ncbi:A-kinase anchor protein SPHKAP isoform X2 [Pseudophryne corroboree]|uniref:A-kinase anchor protein SPHKAP isoform X2 n=1 Tax=Pseudophryne corroboree TaxID=495146 RepID=UPI0030820AB2
MCSCASHSCELAAMYGPLDKYGSSGCSSLNDTSTSNLGSSIMACKKVICPSRSTDSLEYWLQNSKNLCKIGLVEDRLDSNCASISFVNINALKEGSSHEAFRKKLDKVSPDLQKLIHSVRSQELRENEILLLSGVTNRKCAPTAETQQVMWPNEICLLQRGRMRKYSSNYIILELNKFLLGLELAQENNLQPDTSAIRAEDDTNCSVSSIEEDFLTASEQLEENSEEENSRAESPDEIKKVKRKGTENSQNKKSKGTNLKNEEPVVNLENWKELERSYEMRRPSLMGHSFDETIEYKTERRKPVGELCRSEIYVEQAGDRNILHDKVCGVDDYTDSFEDPATTGQYATNLAECVLQDAFIRLSQSDNSFTKEAAVSISASDSGVICKGGSPAASRSWNELPKIVIVQSPDSCETPTEWIEESQWPEQESPTSVSDHWTDEKSSSGFTQSTLEVALACAASVIGTISSSQPSQQIIVEQNYKMDSEKKDTAETPTTDTVGFPGVVLGTEFSVPTALCEMTRVASAVAVCGLSEQKQGHYPTTSTGLLVAADASAAVTLHCSIALGSSMEKLKGNIAKALLREAAVVLTSPCTYRNLEEFIESINEKIRSSVSSCKLAHVGDVVNDDLAHNLSDTILRHSAEEAIQRLQSAEGKQCSSAQSDFVSTTTELLFSVMDFTCKKMSDLVQSGDLPSNFVADDPNSVDPDLRQVEDMPDMPIANRAPGQWNENQLANLYIEQKPEPISHKLSQNEATDSNTLPAVTKASCSKQCLKRERYKRHHNEHRAFLARESTVTEDECKFYVLDKESIDRGINSGSYENLSYDLNMSKDFTLNTSLVSNYKLLSAQAVLPLKHPISNYCLTDFADDLAETVVSMATEIAAICLENSNGRQPWFCAWAKSSECLLTPGRTVKRKKETSSGGSVVRRHRPPRLSEIKKKTDEHPELKERLMNRVVDESINLEDAPDSVNAFANEVASKIMNLTESSVADSLWQGQNLSRNRLHCDRWNRGKASSYESIPEEDLYAKSLLNTLGPGYLLGQPFSRTSSVSKQSSCESITDEFSRFMVNQMENEGREFELLLDYYAGKNANTILNSALQQVSRRNSHLNVKPSCLSKQSSTESITEEFYRYMLKEIDKESKDIYSSRNTAEWTSKLMPPSPRTPFCFRQSSMPCNRSSSARLTVNAPVKANSLDGFSRSGSREFLNIQPVSAISSTNLCKSDSCLYQRCQTDQATDMLIYETWSSSIESLMRKNKIIADRTDSIDPESSPKGSPAHVDTYANKLAVDIVQSGKTLIVQHQDSLDSTNKESFNNHNISRSQCSLMDNEETLAVRRETSVHQGASSTGHMEVPLIQIETDQREETEEEDKGNVLEITILEDVSKQSEERSITHVGVRSPQVKQVTGSFPKVTPRPEFPTPLSSSEDSTGSWSQLVNEEENPEDASSFLQLSERSTSNGNCSTTSSVGVTDMEAFMEVIPPGLTPDMKPEKLATKDLQENPDECTSGLSVGTASCQQEVSVLNIDLDSECSDRELRTTLQWIAASELGIPTVYFTQSQESSIQKFLEVTRLVQAKSWKVGDIFSALILHSKTQVQGSVAVPSFFDWLLEMG